jgi:hypothetical protein
LTIADNRTFFKGNIMLYIPEVRNDLGSNFTNFQFSKILDQGESEIDGKFIFKSIFDKYLYAIEIRNGKQIAFAEMRPKNGLDKMRQSDETCIHWYLITTYYFADGTTDTTEEYVGTTCYGSCQPNELCDVLEGGGGGVQTDYEYEVGKTEDWRVAGNPIEPANGEVKSIERIKGKRVSSEPQGGHFVSITHYSSGCNFCTSANPYDVWTEGSVNVNISSPQVASSTVTGTLQFQGVTYPISNSNTWSFQTLFP